MSVQVNNLIIASKLKLISNLLQIEGASIWRRKPYDKAAEILSDLNVSASTIPNFESYAGIGAGTAGAIDSIIKTGTCLVLDDLRKKHPKAEKAFGLTVVSGVGVKTAISLYNSGITTLEELSDACDLGKVSNGQIVRGVKLALKSRGRLPINEVLPVMIPLLESIRNQPEVTQAEFCGSVRRGKETIKDVDVIVVSTDRAKTAAFFDTLGDTLIAGVEKARVMVPLDARTSVQFDLLFADTSNFGAALAYFTGSKEHNISMRQRAISFGLTLNEHGFATKAGGVRTDGATEDGIYKKLKLPWCPPEIREGSNLPASIPKLVTRSDITGDWHMHTFWSADAKDSVLDMAVAAKARGLQMIGLTDHTEKQYGWDPNKIKDRAAECRDASDFLDMPIYPACETGVNKDGSLDWDDKYLKQMAYVIASIHKSHAVDPVKRLIAAARHPMVKIIGHPTGRSMGRRDIPQDDWADLFKVCVQEGVLVEINGARLDLPVDLIKMAKAEGCKFVLNGDAHSINELHWQDYAITLARRAGLTKSDLGKPSWKAV